LLLSGHAYAGYKYSVLPYYPGDAPPYNTAADINNAGQVVGTLVTPANPKATVWSPSGTVEQVRPGGVYDFGNAINDKGEVAGGYEEGPYVHAFASPYSDSSLGGVAASNPEPATVAMDINNKGLVVGYGLTDDPAPYYYHHAVAWDGTHTTDLNPAWASISYAYGVNDSNVIVGVADGQAVEWNGGVATTLGAGTAYDINNAGVVAGKSGSNAVIWNGGVETILGAGQANALNILSQVVGVSGGHAFLWANGKAIDLNNFLSEADRNAGVVMEEATGINDHGWIVGNAFNPVTDAYQAFVLSPVPEPSTWLLLLGGLGFIAWRARKAGEGLAPVAA
jgi:uncharacterized membrane protein